MKVDNEYIMSPKDLKTIDFLDKILNAGVSVLKIEGRGRSPEYVKTVVSCYREAVDAYFAGTYNEKKITEWNRRLKTVYNRDFWDGYYLGRKLGEWTGKPGSQATRKKIYVGKIENYYARIGVVEIKMHSHDLKQGDEFLIIGPTTGVYEGKVREIRVDYKTVSRAVKGESCSMPVDNFVRRSDKIYKLVPVNADQENDPRYG